VTIRAERVVKPANQPMPFPDDPLFRRFFGDRLPPGHPGGPGGGHREGGLGSGVVVRDDGIILTNHHVIEGAGEIKVELSDRRVYDAKVVGTDPPTDLAVLRIDARRLPSLPLGDSSAVRVGDIVLAFGNPLGVGQTVTMGIISAKGRHTGLNDGGFEDFLQTDAPINRGNSGGALVDLEGRLVGINSQIMSPSGGNIGIGFAIPASMAGSVMDQLLDGGTVRRGQLGVTIQPVTPELARGLGLDDLSGALVSSVTEGSAAARAGVERGDVIVSLDGRRVADGNELRNLVAGTAPGSRVALGVLRDGSPRELSVTLGELAPRAEKVAAAAGPADDFRLGIGVRPLGREDLDELGLPAGTRGLRITEVDPEGAAAAAGLAPGDVIERANNQPVGSVAELKAALERSGDRPAVLLVQRQGNALFVAVERPRD
jgi:Do/DeqQ family serine protease